jgi:hypothetical protein
MYLRASDERDCGQADATDSMRANIPDSSARTRESIDAAISLDSRLRGNDEDGWTLSRDRKIINSLEMQ